MNVKSLKASISRALAFEENKTNDASFIYTVGSGHNVGMTETDLRIGYSARLLSPYINTTDNCLELFHLIKAGDRGWNWNRTRIVIKTISEELEESTVAVVDGKSTEYVRLFFPLPPGVNQIAIDGIRDQLSPITSAIFIDDITIMSCSRFGRDP